jgi:excisionase family DNA binding protein
MMKGPMVGLYSPAEVAEQLGCSEWWVKEQARRRRIPFAWIGGSYRFTHEHLDEIIRIFEVRPTKEGAGTAPRRRAPGNPANQTTPLLRAKHPRRARRTGSVPSSD